MSQMSELEEMRKTIHSLTVQVEKTNTILECTLPTFATKDEVSLQLANLRGRSYSWVKLGPIVLAAALGLLGIGAYLGSDKVSTVQARVDRLDELIKKAE